MFSVEMMRVCIMVHGGGYKEPATPDDVVIKSQSAKGPRYLNASEKRVAANQLRRE